MRAGRPPPISALITPSIPSSHTPLKVQMGFLSDGLRSSERSVTLKAQITWSIISGSVKNLMTERAVIHIRRRLPRSAFPPLPPLLSVSQPLRLDFTPLLLPLWSMPAIARARSPAGESTTYEMDRQWLRRRRRRRRRRAEPRAHVAQRRRTSLAQSRQRRRQWQRQSTAAPDRQLCDTASIGSLSSIHAAPTILCVGNIVTRKGISLSGKIYAVDFFALVGVAARKPSAQLICCVKSTFDKMFMIDYTTPSQHSTAREFPLANSNVRKKFVARCLHQTSRQSWAISEENTRELQVA